MFKLRPRLRVYFVICSLSQVLACPDAGTTGEDTGTGTSTGTSPATPDIPTAAASTDDPTPTTTLGSVSTTGDDPGVSDTMDATTTDTDSNCGNGVVDPGEACDDSLAGNDDTRFCTADCTLNVCGDGKLLIGWELCDNGPGNSDAYGSICGAQCVPGPRCGDHALQPEFETCDLGLDNGGSKGDEQGILCDATCRAQQLRGFVTEATFTGDLGGFFGADLKCRDAAAAVGLAQPDRFQALLSSGDVDAKSRFEMVAGSLPYVLVTGKKFAENFTALVEAGPLGEGLAVTETGGTLYKKYVATNTAPGGIHYSPDQHCQGWTSANAAHRARVGINAVPIDAPDWPGWQAIQAWIGSTDDTCDLSKFHLYCLEI